MTVTTTWDIVKIECYPQSEGRECVVFYCHWTLSGADGTHSSGVYGATIIPHDTNDAFIPYGSLTKDMVVGWVKEALGNDQVVAYEEAVAGEINNLANPPITTPPLPWSE
jgi:hypothetical protein